MASSGAASLPSPVAKSWAWRWSLPPGIGRSPSRSSVFRYGRSLHDLDGPVGETDPPASRRGAVVGVGDGVRLDAYSNGLGRSSALTIRYPAGTTWATQDGPSVQPTGNVDDLAAVLGVASCRTVRSGATQPTATNTTDANAESKAQRPPPERQGDLGRVLTTVRRSSPPSTSADQHRLRGGRDRQPNVAAIIVSSGATARWPH